MNWKNKGCLGIAQREKNQKRSYVIVNALQGKHIPVSPTKALALFEALGEKIYPHCKGKTTVFIGFAETATAIGSAVAAGCPHEAYYIHTTREQMTEAYKIVEFQEEHSHATEQMLFCKEKQSMLLEADNIIFVEDEITTGKTILNFVEALEKQGLFGKFGAASLVNSMTEERKALFAEKGISLYFLTSLEEKPENVAFSSETVVSEKRYDTIPECNIIDQWGKVEPREGILAKEYADACKTLAEQLFHKVPQTGGNLLVLGTEECMYPAMITAHYFEQKGQWQSVKNHATTRSPIVPRAEENYPLWNRCTLESFYEKGRTTYIYNLQQYDHVLIITDSSAETAGKTTLLRALAAYGNETITLVRWKTE